MSTAESWKSTPLRPTKNNTSLACAAASRLLAHHLTNPEDQPPADPFVAVRWLQRERLFALAASDDVRSRLPEKLREHFAPDLLAATRQRLAARDLILGRGLAAALLALERVGVQPVILKGRALGLTVYAESWHRPHSDIDLLIPPDSVSLVRSTLESEGFELPFGIRGSHTSHQFLYRKTLAGGVELNLDIHWRISNRHLFADVIRYADARGKAASMDICRVTHRIVSPAHALLHALIHLYAHHHDDHIPLLWYLDIHLLVNELSGQELVRILDVAKDRGVFAVCADGLRATVDVCETELPAELRDSLHDVPFDESTRFLEMTRAQEIFSDLRAIASWKNKLIYARELALPPARQMLERYGYEHNYMLPLAHVRRIAGVFSHNKADD